MTADLLGELAKGEVGCMALVPAGIGDRFKDKEKTTSSWVRRRCYENRPYLHRYDPESREIVSIHVFRYRESIDVLRFLKRCRRIAKSQQSLAASSGTGDQPRSLLKPVALGRNPELHRPALRQ